MIRLSSNSIIFSKKISFYCQENGTKICFLEYVFHQPLCFLICTNSKDNFVLPVLGLNSLLSLSTPFLMRELVCIFCLRRSKKLQNQILFFCLLKHDLELRVLDSIKRLSLTKLCFLYSFHKIF